MQQTDWTLKFSSSFKKVRDLYAFLGWELPRSLQAVSETYPLFVPVRLAERIKLQGPHGVLAREFLPSELELDDAFAGLLDPIGDKLHQKAPQLIHRYPSRVLFTPTSVCPVHCRYCFRKNELSPTDELFQQDFEETLKYLRAHEEITELIFTGGDPFTLSNARLSSYLEAFASVPHLRHVRFHTRYPVILPERLDRELLSVLASATARFATVTVAVHANHVDEFDADADAAIRALGQTPVQLLSQTVLLSGVNDHARTLQSLMEKFVALKVRPYYLHHPDRVRGGMHFYLPLERGRRIYGELRGLLPGWALPHYVIDVPGGHGKVPAFNPESFTYSGELLSLQGRSQRLPEPDLFV